MEDLSKLHNVLLDIMIEFDRVCKINNLNYSISFGTMLGAIRHKGFIPWDDDVDIMMPRKDYEKLKKIAKDQFGSTFFFQCYETEEMYPYAISRLRKNGTSMIYENWINSGFHQGIYIDICPIDNIPDNKILLTLQKIKIIFYTLVRNTRNKEIFIRNLTNNHQISKIIYSILKIFNKPGTYLKEQTVVQKYNNNVTKLCGIICEGKNLINTPKDMKPFPSCLIQEYIEVEFERKTFKCFKNYDELLNRWYGNYMELPPEEERIVYHKPLFFSDTINYSEVLNNKRKFI